VGAEAGSACVLIHGANVSAELLAALGAVEALCFPQPWGIAGLKGSLEQSGAAVACLPLPPEPAAASGQATQLLAYCLYQRLCDEIEILQLGTHPDRQRQGLGRRLLDFVLTAAAASGCGAVFLEVRRGNVAARCLYEAAGFQVCGQRPGYYPLGSEREDALLLRRNLHAEAGVSMQSLTIAGSA
jgi:ribosomal-protein-alanine N-acetyltransferase